MRSQVSVDCEQYEDVSFCSDYAFEHPENQRVHYETHLYIWKIYTPPRTFLMLPSTHNETSSHHVFYHDLVGKSADEVTAILNQPKIKTQAQLMHRDFQAHAIFFRNARNVFQRHLLITPQWMTSEMNKKASLVLLSSCPRLPRSDGMAWLQWMREWLDVHVGLDDLDEFIDAMRHGRSLRLGIYQFIPDQLLDAI
jgi:hypothetical protein